MSIKNLPRTTKPQMINALVNSFDSLPQYATIESWCTLMEKYFANIGMKVYCHQSANGELSAYAASRDEIDRYNNAECHCDVEQDMAVLNRDTNDPDGKNSDREFPRPDKSIFFNRQSKPEYICIAYDKLRKMGDAIKAPR
jgi:hypothetical protein